MSVEDSANVQIKGEVKQTIADFESQSSLKVEALNRLRPVPNCLSHYTTLTGFLGIFEKKELWFSNISFLNDKQELLYGIEKSAEVIEKMLGEDGYGLWIPVLKRVVARFENENVAGAFVGCFCEKDNLLSQWRGYAGADQGISIVFKTAALQAILEPTGAEMFPVEYGPKATKGSIRAALFEDLTTNQPPLFDDPRFYEIDHVLFDKIVLLSPRFKHSGFREEKEWRFVIQKHRVIGQPFYRVRGNVLLPYLKIALPTDADNFYKIIDHIRVGPGADAELTEKSINMYLNSIGLGDINVLSSNIPYRV